MHPMKLLDRNRINRTEYFMVSIINIGLLIAGALFASTQSTFGYLIMIAACIYSIFTSIVAAINRLHDLNLTGWLCLVTLVPYIGVLFSIYMLFAAGSDSTNQYGKAPDAA